MLVALPERAALYAMYCLDRSRVLAVMASIFPDKNDGPSASGTKLSPKHLLEAIKASPAFCKAALSVRSTVKVF